MVFVNNTREISMLQHACRHPQHVFRTTRSSTASVVVENVVNTTNGTGIQNLPRIECVWHIHMLQNDIGSIIVLRVAIWLFFRSDWSECVVAELNHERKNIALFLARFSVIKLRYNNAVYVYTAQMADWNSKLFSASHYDTQLALHTVHSTFWRHVLAAR